MLHLGLELNVAHPRQISTTTLSIDDKPIEAHIVTSATTPPASINRTVVVIHGLAASAHNDPRILRLAHAIVSGHPFARVVVPYIPALAECQLTDQTVGFIEKVVRVVSENTELSPSGRLSIASPCISAGLSLVAAAKVNTAVHAVLCIGTHALVENVFDHCVEREGRDDSRYAINSVLSSFMEPKGGINKLLAAYVEDDHNRNVGRSATALEERMQEYPEEAKEYRRLHDDHAYLKTVMTKVYRENEGIFLAMSPVRYLDELKCESLSLVHAVTDDVVPNSESVVLGNALKDRKDMQVRTCITPLLNHGDQKPPSLSDIPDILKLISTFAGFFVPDNTLKNRKDKVA